MISPRLTRTVVLAAVLGAVAPPPTTAQPARSSPCDEGPRYAEFDFWLGTWDVYDPQGQKVGVNEIRKVENGCLLVESWTGAAGGTGTSINYLDPATGRWVQQWVSANGVVIKLEGELRAGSMELAGELISPDGTSQPFRGAWTPAADGSVRQHFEISADGGATWSTWFDGKYVRAENGGGE